jgi:hypothetical protein
VIADISDKVPELRAGLVHAIASNLSSQQSPLDLIAIIVPAVC